MRGKRSRIKYSALQREAIFRLKIEGRTGREVAAILAQGYGHLEPFTIPRETVNRIYYEQRRLRGIDGRDLASEAPTEAVDELVREMVRLAQRRVEQLRRKVANGSVDAREMRQAVALLKELRAETAKIRSTKGKAARSVPESSFVASLADPEPSISEDGERQGEATSMNGAGEGGPDEARGIQAQDIESAHDQA